MNEPDVIANSRIREWWKPKATNLLVILYAAFLLGAEPLSAALLWLLLLSCLTILGIASTGHLLNDWGDIDADARAGKPNALAGRTPGTRATLLAAALVLGLAPWLWLPADGNSAALLALEFALLFAYSLPPLRLKERGMAAVVTDAAYACAVPAVLAMHTALLAGGRALTVPLLVTLLVWQFALGMRHYLDHLALDRTNDLASGTTTLATRRGNRYLHGVIRQRLLPLEGIGLAGFLAVVGAGAGLPPVLLPAAALAVLLLLSTMHVVLAVGRGYPLIVHRFGATPLDRVCQDWLPLVLLACLAAHDWHFAAIAPLHALPWLLPRLRAALPARHGVRHPSAPALAWSAPPLAPLAAAGPGEGTSAIEGSGRGERIAAREGGACIEGAGRVAASAGRKPPAATGIDGAADPAAPVQRAPPRPRPTGSVPCIAVANVNKGKYTETFVDGLIGRLDFEVCHLHGGELPRYDDDDRHLLSNWPSLQSLAGFLEAALHLPPDRFLRSSLCSYLQARRAELVLAHFGPVAVQMLPVARDLGIPLIACFHGYDVFHDETVAANLSGYRDVFREADRLVGVSEGMLERLRELGAPPHKLVHLPAWVDLERFPCSDHSDRGPHFLAVGRFAETKSPHLTLLAFARVAASIPEATLTMIGRGGGGELYEACRILARALHIEDRVRFLGVRSHAEVAAAMREARVFVQHSVTTPEHGDREGKPVAVMEAMASGLAVVATRHAGIAELIDDGVTGLLVDEYDVEAMAGRMLELARDDDRVRRLGADAGRAIHGHPLIAHHVERLEALVRDAIARSRGVAA